MCVCVIFFIDNFEENKGGFFLGYMKLKKWLRRILKGLLLVKIFFFLNSFSVRCLFIIFLSKD